MRVTASITYVATCALLVTTPALARASSTCGGSTFSTCASGSIKKIQVSNKVRLRIEKGLPDLARVPDESAFSEGSEWRISGDSARIEALPRAVSAAKPNAAAMEHSAADLEGAAARGKGLHALRGDVVADHREDKPNVRERFVSAAPFEFDLLPAPGGGKEAEAPDNVDRDCPTGGNREGQAALCDDILTPEPSSLVLMITALAGLTALGWQRRPRV